MRVNFHEITYREDLIEINTHRPMYQNNMKMVLDKYTAIREGFVVKPRHI